MCSGGHGLLETTGGDNSVTIFLAGQNLEGIEPNPAWDGALARVLLTYH